MDHSTLLPSENARNYADAVVYWEEVSRLYNAWRHRRGGPELLAAADRAAEEHGFGRNRPGQANYNVLGGSGRSARNHPTVQRLQQDQQRFGFYYLDNWDAWMTSTFATPVSDGQHVYAYASNDQIACFDLEGNLVWMVRDVVTEHAQTGRRTGRPDRMMCRYAHSPRLSGDVLIVSFAGHMRGYDKRTGERRWYVSHDALGGSHIKVGTPPLMRLQADGRTLDVICAPEAGIYRVEDGVQIGALPELRGYEGATAVVHDDIIIRQSAPDQGEGGIWAHRVVATSRDAVTVEEVWQHVCGRRGGTNTTPVLHAGRVYFPFGSGRTADFSRSIDVQTGQIQLLPVGVRSSNSPVLGGAHLFCISGGGRQFATRDQTDRGTVVPYRATVIGLDGQVQQIDNAFFDDRYEDDDYFLRWAFRAFEQSNSSPMLQGNRLFFRTTGYLWSIGTSAWHTPAGAPPQARVP